MTLTGNILDRIVEKTRESLLQRIKARPLAEVQSLAFKSGLPRDFAGAIRKPGINVIAEIKRASPSKGWLNESLDVGKTALAYEAGGASALSVLTEAAFFHGSFSDLDHARSAADIPVLCKDFILTPYQVFEARMHKADAVLLIVALLEEGALRELIEIARSLNMVPLVETHDENEVRKAVACGARVVGINNRNLTDFSVDLNTTVRLRPGIPAGKIVVSESGIRTREDVNVLEKAGVNAILVGEALVTSSDPASEIRKLRVSP